MLCFRHGMFVSCLSPIRNRFYCRNVFPQSEILNFGTVCLQQKYIQHIYIYIYIPFIFSSFLLLKDSISSFWKRCSKSMFSFRRSSHVFRNRILEICCHYINDNLTHFVERLIPSIKDKVSSEHLKSINIWLNHILVFYKYLRILLSCL